MLREAGDVDADALPGQIDDLDLQLSDLEAQRSDIDQTIGAARSELDRMDGGDRAAEEREEAEELLASIRHLAEKYIQLRVAYWILKEEVERYRQENQGPLLGSAGELFSKLTNGSFAGLDRKSTV